MKGALTNTGERETQVHSTKSAENTLATKMRQVIISTRD